MKLSEKKDYYIQSLAGELHSLIVGMEPAKEPVKKATKKTEKKTISESTEKIKLSLHVGTIVCDDCFDCEVSNELWNGSPDRLLSNIIYDGKFYELCEIKNGKSYTETDIVDCNLQSLE